MKWLINGVLIVLVLVLAVPTFLLKSLSEDPPEPTAQPEDLEKIIIITQVEDITLSMYHHSSKKIIELPLEEYLEGVVSGEMPASFDMEALKAQAVAARTLAIYKALDFGGRGCNQKEGADVCSSFAHCQEWISIENRRKNWGDDFELNYNRIRQAVLETRGEIITYKGRPIEVLYHSTSNGKTEDSGQVFSTSLPYYTVVTSMDGEDSPKFHNSTTWSNQRFIDIFKSRYSNSKLSTGSLSNQIKIKGYTESGRVRDLTVGGITLRATEFRLLYGLYSTDFSFSFGKDTVTIATKGFGHGVGMSQVGADVMGKKGYSYKEILKHYYQGTIIQKY